ncbi:uncharacterized protein LOC106129324 [Amyelois transitella]|uniref:uncharacterized protein LOC106129324 n=1 Tax=Amyelois transitella TaxID=680683 RepID=UPI00067CEA3F|nr:uncharacterized protein LOC106129324 [Amyelois transitella]
MRQSLVPVILLATVALSSSNVLPFMSINRLETEPLGFNSPNDNIFRDNKNIFNDLFYKISIGTSLNNPIPKVQKLPKIKFDDFDNNRGEAEFNSLSKDQSYNGEGYRKKQWHNYPRQLDRLHNYFYGRHRAHKRNPDPDDPDKGSYEIVPETHRSNDITTNEYIVYSDDGAQSIYDTVIANTNPFLILKIRLACLSNKLKNTGETKQTGLALPDYNLNENDDKLLTNEINPSMDAVKVKREDISGLQGSMEVERIDGKRTVKKRLFSLWSRLQSLNHKGHELQHRRHLHAFYGLPEDGNGVLTAETRATLMRPPGSPLRWG